MAIDLRSDTVTQPTPGMRKAIANAEVADDVLDRDPTTHRLEERVAALLGMEAALFFPTGCQANAAALWLLTRPGTEVIVEADAHHVHYELAALAGICSVQIRPVATPNGLLTAELAREAFRPSARYMSEVSGISAENTHNAAGGKVMPLAVWDGLVALARDAGLPLHLDGARLWHAALALDVSLERVARGATTVMVSFSKGLACPIGSCLAGSRELIERAWRVRKRLGGGMRQTGLLAAAALYALDEHLPRLADDHAKAKLLAERLGGHPAITPQTPETNIVMLELLRPSETSDTVILRLADAGVRLVAFGSTRLRAVTHLDVSRADVEQAADIIARVLR